MLYPALLYPAYTPDLLATEFEHRWLQRPLHGGSIAEIDRVCFIVPGVCAWNQFSIRRAEHGLAHGESSHRAYRLEFSMLPSQRLWHKRLVDYYHLAAGDGAPVELGNELVGS